MLRIALLVALSGTALQAQSPAFDVIIRGGTVLDGSGQSRFDADVGIRNGFIVSIGDLAIGTATEIVDARGLFVVPGFINIHSHASPDALHLDFTDINRWGGPLRERGAYGKLDAVRAAGITRTVMRESFAQEILKQPSALLSGKQPMTGVTVVQMKQ